MDAFAVGLRVAQNLIDDKVLENVVDNRYKTYTEGIGLAIVEGKTNFQKLEEYAFGLSDIKQTSGRLEQIKATINQYLLKAFAN